MQAGRGFRSMCAIHYWQKSAIFWLLRNPAESKCGILAS
jgi:hypothetical protein